MSKCNSNINKNKNNQSFLFKSVILILLFIIMGAGIVTLYTLSRYITNKTESSSAELAGWSFKVTGSGGQSIDNIDFATTRTDNNTSVVSNCIAPGTNGKIDLSVDTRGSEVQIRYDLALIAENCPTNLKFYSDSNYTKQMKTTRTGTGAEGDPKVATVTKIKFIEKNKQGVYDETIYWKWDYESNPGVDISEDDFIDTEDMDKIVTASLSITGYEVPDESVVPDVFVETGGDLFDTIQEAIDAVPDNSETPVRVRIFQDISESFTIPVNKNVWLDMQTNTVSNNGANPVIELYGKLTINNGTITSSAGQGAINVKSTGELTMESGKIMATGSRQAIYIDGGKVTISGDSYLSSTTQERATVQNQSNGKLTITGGKIVSTRNAAVQNAGTMTIGTHDGEIHINTIILQGGTYGVNSSSNFSFYDGIAKGVERAFSSETKITSKEDGYDLLADTEVIDGKTYKTAYLSSGAGSGVAEYGGAEYSSVESAISDVPANTEATIYILKDASVELKIQSNKKIKLDLQNHILERGGTSSTIENFGTLEIVNGTVSAASGNFATIDNKSSGKLKINNATIRSTGTRQAIYNEAGKVEITGNSYITSTATGQKNGDLLERATIQNLGAGEVTIEGGTIIGVNQQAISNEGILTIGIKADGNVSPIAPEIRGKTYGIKATASSTIKYYDGIIKGITGLISGTITEQESNTQIVNGTEQIDTLTYQTMHLE